MAKKIEKDRSQNRGYYDFNLVAVVILLTCFGLVMLYSTSAYIAQVQEGDDMFYFRKQTLISAASILIALLASKFDYHLLYYISGFIYFVSLALMWMVKYTPFGVEVLGARRWLKLGVQFQPSEIAKIAAITFIPCLLIKMGRQVNTLRGILVLAVVGGMLGFAAYVWTENLSTGIIITAITAFMVFIVYYDTRRALYFGAGVAGLIVLARIILQITLAGQQVQAESFRIRRVLVWLNPELYSSGGGYQIMQALYAIGSGGFWGKGLGNSVQKLGPVPEAQNDMIFAIVCEELGIFGGLIVLGLFAYLLYRLFFIAQNAPDFYGSMIVSGIFIHIALQVILNICVVLNWIPTTGITLPFVSFGGTSIMFLMAEMGIALSVSRKIEFAE